MSPNFLTPNFLLAVVYCINDAKISHRKDDAADGVFLTHHRAGSSGSGRGNKRSFATTTGRVGVPRYRHELVDILHGVRQASPRTGGTPDLCIPCCVAYYVDDLVYTNKRWTASAWDRQCFHVL